METRTQHDRAHGNTCSDVCLKCEEKTQQHTPTPWHTSHIENPNADGEKFPLLRICADQQVICETFEVLPRHNDRANFAFIVRAVNSHEALLKAAKKAMSDYYAGGIHHLSNEAAGLLREAIAQAEKGK